MNNNKPNIFIVDDSSSFRKVLKLYLTMKNVGNIIGEASNGQELLDVFPKLDIDIILMDLNMPILNGIETTRMVDELYHGHAKIIGLTENDEFDYMKSMIEAGASAYVVKSEMGTQLLEAINTAHEGGIFYPDLIK